MPLLRRRFLAGVLCFAAAGGAAKAAERPRLVSRPFTLERVLGDARPSFPNVALPIDPPAAQVRADEDIAYLRRGRTTLQLDVYRPAAAAAPAPAVLMLHGGGWESGSRQMERAFGRALAAQGLVGIPVSYRLGAEGRFPGAVHDAKQAVAWVRRNAARFGVDPRCIAIAGGSAGGHLAALVGASNGEASLDDRGARPADSTVQAVVDIDGAANFPDAALIAQEQQREGSTTRFLGGDYASRRATWFAASPLTYVGPSSAPTLFIDSNGATPILPGRREMHDRLRALGIASEIVDMPAGVPHPFWLMEPWFTPTVQRTAAFVKAACAR